MAARNNCLSRSVPEIHWHVTGTVSSQPTNTLSVPGMVNAVFFTTHVNQKCTVNQTSYPFSPPANIHLSDQPLINSPNHSASELCDQNNEPFAYQLIEPLMHPLSVSPSLHPSVYRRNKRTNEPAGRTHIQPTHPPIGQPIHPVQHTAISFIKAKGALICRPHNQACNHHPTKYTELQVAYCPTRTVCWLTAERPSNMLVYVRDGSDNCTCCRTEIKVADQTFYLTQPQYIDTGPTSPSADPITPGAWQGSQPER